MDASDWLDTPALCQELAISRSTLSRWRRRGLLTSGHHWVRKNPACPRSDLLWQRHRCSALLRFNASPACRAMPKPDPSEATDYVLLHRDTGSALSTTRATEAEVHRANDNLKLAGQRSRFVPAKHLMHHRQAPAD
ncbi:MAG: hypothetical protein ACKOPT_09245 [Cyanobium sp.]